MISVFDDLSFRHSCYICPHACDTRGITDDFYSHRGFHCLVNMQISPKEGKRISNELLKKLNIYFPKYSTRRTEPIIFLL